jgi:DNA-binding GntR family transcriptional regulator
VSLNTDDPRAAYLQVADALRRDIRTGELKPGERVPSIRALSDRFGVSAMTIQSALRELRNLDLITTQQGRGTFVRSDALSALSRLTEEQSQSADYLALSKHLDTIDETVRNLAQQLQELQAEVRSNRSQQQPQK